MPFPILISGLLERTENSRRHFLNKLVAMVDGEDLAFLNVIVNQQIIKRAKRDSRNQSGEDKSGEDKDQATKRDH